MQVIKPISGVSFSVGKGEVLVLAGESGSGKSVTALSITGILPSYAKIISGEVIFKGTNVLSLDEKSLNRIRGKEIAYIFQEPSSALNPLYTIGDQIAETIRVHQGKNVRQSLQEAEKLLKDVKISDPRRVLRSYPHQLSGGMNQRVFIAMSLAGNPELLIADEPTTSLDVTIEYEILKLLMGLRREMDFSLLFITHNLSIAHRIADRIAIMYKGGIVEEGNTGRIFSDPGHFHTKELIAAYEKMGKI